MPHYKLYTNVYLEEINSVAQYIIKLQTHFTVLICNDKDKIITN
jgi:hypothetical protein